MSVTEPVPANKRRRRASYSSTSTDSSSSRPRSARHPPRRSLLRAHTATSTTSLRASHPSLSSHHDLPCAERSAAIYKRSCELFPRPLSASRVTSPNQDHQPPQDPTAARRHLQDGYFDSDPYRTSTDIRPTASPTSAARPAKSWSFAKSPPSTSPGLPSTAQADEKSEKPHDHPPQTITYWTTPATRAEIEAELCRAERNALRRAWRSLAPSWLLRIKGKGLGTKGDRVCYWDGVEDGSSIRRFRVS